MGVLRHLAGDTLASVRRAGLRNTWRIIASSVRDSDFDRRYGTDTAGYEDPRTYAADDPRAQRATFYVPTRAAPFLSFLRQASVDATGAFVDFGCGKGRALLVAAQYGFHSVTGIEFSAAMCRAAERNIERFRVHAPATRFEVICGDAGDYQVRPQDSVFYFYDPFDDALIVRCLGNVRASVEQHPRQVAVVYHNSIAVGPTPFDQVGFLVAVPLPRFDGNAFYLFHGTSPVAQAERHRSAHARAR